MLYLLEKENTFSVCILHGEQVIFDTILRGGDLTEALLFSSQINQKPVRWGRICLLQNPRYQILKHRPTWFIISTGICGFYGFFYPKSV